MILDKDKNWRFLYILSSYMLNVACIINHTYWKKLIFNDGYIAELAILFKSRICEESIKYRQTVSSIYINNLINNSSFYIIRDNFRHVATSITYSRIDILISIRFLYIIRLTSYTPTYIEVVFLFSRARPLANI